MNKLSIMAKGVVLAMGMIGVTYASNDSPQYSSLNSWHGIYAGVAAGFIFNDVQLRSHQIGFTNPSENCNTSANFSTFSPGIQLGYLSQFPNTLVSGIEANFNFNTNQKNTLACSCPNNPNVSDRFSFRSQMKSSIKGRVGHSLNWNKGSFLPYLTAGASFANVRLTYKNEGGDYYSKNTGPTGWLLGAGIEWAFRQNWSLRAEYNYVDYENTIKLKIPSLYGLIDPNGSARVDLHSNSIAVAINYWI